MPTTAHIPAAATINKNREAVIGYPNGSFLKRTVQSQTLTTDAALRLTFPRHIAP